MAISDLGNGIGYLYITEPDGTSFVSSTKNNEHGARLVKSLSNKAMSMALNQSAVASIVFGTPAGVGSVTKILINSVDQMSGSVAYTGASTANDVASGVATEINGHSAASGPDYTAIAIGDTCYVMAPPSSGSSVNGLTTSTTTTGNINVVDGTFAGGSDASNVYDEGNGYRFYINASASAAEGNLTGATEITSFIIQRSLSSAIPTQEVTIASGVITVTRESVITNVVIDTQASAASDDLTDIVPEGWAEKDILILWGKDSGRVTTFKTTGNLTLQGSNEFSTGDKANKITLQYENGVFYEVGRTTQQIGTVANYRMASFPFGKYGSDTITAADNTTVTLVPGTDEIHQVVSGTDTLSGGDFNITLSTTGVKDGDHFIIEYNAVVTIGAGDVIIGGRTLTANEALAGGLFVFATYGNSAWQVTILYDLNQGYKLASANYGAGSVDASAVATGLKTEVITVPVSFETGEQAANKVKMPYAGTVNEIYAISTKAIAATDSATITPKDNAGTTMTGGVITFAASDVIDTAYTSTPTANNTFVAGDILSFTSAKATAGGKALVSIKITKT